MDHLPEEIIRELRDAIRPVSYRPPTPASHPMIEIPKPSRPAWAFFSLVPWFVGAGVVVVGLLYVSQNGIQMKARVVQEGNAAIGNLVAAKADLEQLNFIAAEQNFTQAHEGFSRARDELGLIGSGLGSLLAKLPGGEKIRSAQNLIRAGQLISDAGTSLTKAVAALSSSASILDPNNKRGFSLAQLIGPTQKALEHAHANISQAAVLLADVDPSVLPADAQEQFDSFMVQLPRVQALLGSGDEAVAFLSRLVGTDQPRRYLLLFQNASELRPTGGFPGSYGLVTFEDGRLRDMTTDDIYNPDGQIKQLVVPPLQLQGITPSWGMRDANWFIDFPLSAKKVAEYYRKGGGTAVDGAIALRPEIISQLLQVTGPIALPQYNVVLTAENFIPTVQLEVESQKTSQPKKIIMDLTPLLLGKLSSLPADQWARVLGILKDGLAQRDVMMYMQDIQMQKYIVAQSWDGGVKVTPGDYLMVNVSNIKGAKADAVTNTSLKLESWLRQGTMTHRLTITRVHNGGRSEYGFYNKTNYSYVRVLVPKGSALRGIQGNDRQVIRPMVDYMRADVLYDPDLVALERTYQYDPVTSATTYEESGKTGFGFWMSVEPGKTHSVQLEYIVPAHAAASDYQLYVQRQSGLDLADFEFTLQKEGVTSIGIAEPALTAWPDSWRLHDRLKKDLPVHIQMK